MLPFTAPTTALSACPPLYPRLFTCLDHATGSFVLNSSSVRATGVIYIRSSGEPFLFKSTYSPVVAFTKA